MAMCRAAQEVVFLRHLLRTLNVEHHQPTMICEDDEAEIN